MFFGGPSQLYEVWIRQKRRLSVAEDRGSELFLWWYHDVNYEIAETLCGDFDRLIWHGTPKKTSEIERTEKIVFKNARVLYLTLSHDQKPPNWKKSKSCFFWSLLSDFALKKRPTSLITESCCDSVNNWLGVAIRWPVVINWDQFLVPVFLNFALISFLPILRVQLRPKSAVWRSI